MDRTVRWAYTNERYDIASFLSGGELVIIEGSALLGHMGDDEVIRYVDTLVDAGVAGLAIELVEGVRTVPKAMIARADERGLPVIGMHRRMPFVDLCQSINTSIVKDQLLVQVRLGIGHRVQIRHGTDRGVSSPGRRHAAGGNGLLI